VSAWSLVFQAQFDSTTAPKGRAAKEAHLRFTSENLVDPVTCEQVTLDKLRLIDWATDADTNDSIKKHMEDLAEFSDSSAMYHLGEALFSDRSMGPIDPKIKLMRNVLLDHGNTLVEIRVCWIASTACPSRVDNMNESFLEQAA